MPPDDRATPRAPVRPLLVAVFAVAAGLATGILTLAGQGVLPAELNRLANSGAIWVTVAFAVGTLTPSRRAAAVAGTLTLLLAVAGYYGAAAVAGAGVNTSSLLIWGGTAVIGGPVFGAAGEAWRHEPGRARALASSLLGAVYLAEGAFTLISIPDMAPAGWAEVVAGIVIVLVLPRTARERRDALLGVIPLLALGVVAYALIDRLFQMR